MKHLKVPEKVVSYIWRRNGEEIAGLTRSHLASLFGINQNYLSKLFKESTSVSLSEFICFVKMEKAQEMLKNRPDLTIETIARMVGFEKCQHFRQKFYKYYQLKPHSYRELFRK